MQIRVQIIIILYDVLFYLDGMQEGPHLALGTKFVSRGPIFKRKD